MLKEKIEGMIMSAMKNADAKTVLGKEITVKHNNLVNALKQIKVEIVNAEKSGKSYNEIDILKKLKKQHEDSIESYKLNGRNDLAEDETEELSVIKTFLPEDVSEDVIKTEVEKMVSQIKETHEPSMRDMGVVMTTLKAKYPTVDGKVVSEFFKKIICK